MRTKKVSYGEEKRIVNPGDQYDARRIRIDIEVELAEGDSTTEAMTVVQNTVIKLIAKRATEVFREWGCDGPDAATLPVQEAYCVPLSVRPTTVDPAPEQQGDIEYSSTPADDDLDLPANLEFADDFLDI